MFKIKTPPKNQAGFTYIELIVVIAIIGILSVFAVISFQASQKNGRDRQRMSDLAQLAAALETYRARYGVYPPEAPLGCDSSRGTGGSCNGASDWALGSDIRELITKGILASLPKDPLNKTVGLQGATPFNATFVYHIELDGQSPSGTPSCGTVNSCRYLMQTLLENGNKVGGGKGVCKYSIIGGGVTPQAWNAGTCLGNVVPLGWNNASIPCCIQ